VKIIYPLFFIVLLSTCIMDPPSHNNDDNKHVKIDSLTLDYQHYILPDKPTKHEEIPKFKEKAELGKVLFFTRPVGEDADMPPIKSPSSIGVFGSKNLLWTGLAGSPKDPLEGLFLPILGQGLLATKAHDMGLVADSVRAHHPAIFEQLKDVYAGVEDDRFSDRKKQNEA